MAACAGGALLRLQFLRSPFGVIFQLGWRTIGMPFDFALDSSRPFSLNLSDIFDYVFVLSLLIFLVRRFPAVRQEEARLSQEIGGGQRGSQSLLIPVSAPATPGFAGRKQLSARPARSAATSSSRSPSPGDGIAVDRHRRRQRQGTCGSHDRLALVGAIRTEAAAAVRRPAQRAQRAPHRPPSRRLRHLPRRAGSPTEANLPWPTPATFRPISTAQELPIPIFAPAGHRRCALTTRRHPVKFSPGDRLTFVSDGVVEAQNDTRRTLRLRRPATISTHPPKDRPRRAALRPGRTTSPCLQ